MELFGTFRRFIKRNEKTGESRFTLRTGYPNPRIVICTGVVISYPTYIPLHLSGGMVKEENGEEVFAVQEARAEGKAFEEVSRFLCGKEFTNIGPNIAKQIIDTIGTDIFSAVRETSDISELSSKIPATQEAVASAIKRVKGITVLEDLHKDLQRRRGDYHNAAGIFYVYGENAAEVIARNPYILLYSGTSLKICEEIAKENGIEHCDKHRMRGIVEHVMISNGKNGNTRITFHNLCKYVWKAEREAGDLYHSNVLFIAEEALSEKYRTEYEDNEVYIYTISDYEAERRIADNIDRLRLSAYENTESGLSIEAVEAICGVTYSKDQKKAFNLLSKTGIKIITGGPGTGKTTILNGILKKYEADNPHNRIVLCAPTGCAARRMRECTGRDASTIHRLLGIRPYENIMNMAITKLDADCVIVDESSMIDTFIMARLLSSVKNGATVILLGDKDQLPSVSAGNVFEDILKSGVVETYFLNSVFRQDKRSLIVENSKRVINGNFKLKENKNFLIKRFDDEESLITEACEMAKRCFEGGHDFKLYTPSKNRKFLSGTIQMNARIRKIRGGKEKEEVSFGSYTFSVGDTVLFNRNNYEKGYYNGQEGVIRDIQRHTGMCYVSIEADSERYSLCGQELADIELAYAITAHKSQGGECTNAIILIPKEPASLLKRQLLYVEITRARENVALLCEKGALELAISKKGEIRRETGLKEMLKAA